MTFEEKVLALLEALAYQQSGRGQSIEAYLDGLYRGYAECNGVAPALMPTLT